MHIRKATLEDIPAIRSMAEVVFPATYKAIITAEQIEYMMDWMYSPDSLAEQIASPGKDFFIALDAAETPCGYISIELDGNIPDGKPRIHLQKIYVMPAAQGTGIGSRMFRHVCDILNSRYTEGCLVELNVNRENPAVAFYERMGMHLDRQGDFPIGNNYFMNDYIYALNLPSRQVPDI